MKVDNAVHPSGAQARAFFAAEDGPFVMVNLLKFRASATYPDGADATLSGAAAYDRYARPVSEMVKALGGEIVYAGAVSGLLLGEVEELWDMVALARYPSRAAMLAMVSSPEYAAIAVHREAGLAGQLNIATKPLADGA